MQGKATHRWQWCEFSLMRNIQILYYHNYASMVMAAAVLCLAELVIGTVNISYLTRSETSSWAIARQWACIFLVIRWGSSLSSEECFQGGLCYMIIDMWIYFVRGAFLGFLKKFENDLCIYVDENKPNVLRRFSLSASRMVVVCLRVLVHPTLTHFLFQPETIVPHYQHSHLRIQSLDHSIRHSE